MPSSTNSTSLVPVKSANSPSSGINRAEGAAPAPTVNSGFTTSTPASSRDNTTPAPIVTSPFSEPITPSSTPSTVTEAAYPLNTTSTSTSAIRRAPYGSILSIPIPGGVSSPAVILKLPAPNTLKNLRNLSPDSELSPPPSTSSSSTYIIERTNNDDIDAPTQALINALSSGPPARSLRPRQKVNYTSRQQPYHRPPDSQVTATTRRTGESPSAAAEQAALLPPFGRTRKAGSLAVKVSPTRAPVIAPPLLFPALGPIDPIIARLTQLYPVPPLSAPDSRRLSQASCTLIKVQAAHLASVLFRKHLAWMVDARKRFERQQALNRHSVTAHMALYSYRPSVRRTFGHYFIDGAPERSTYDFEHEPLLKLSDLKAESNGTIKADTLKMAMKKFMEQSNMTFMEEEKERWSERHKYLTELNAAIREGHLDKIDDALKDDTVIEID